MCVPFPGKVTTELKELYNFMHNQIFQSSETCPLSNFLRDCLERKLRGLLRSPPPVRTEPACSLSALLSLQETPDPKPNRTADSSIPAPPGQDCFWTITPRCPPVSAVSWALPTPRLFPDCKLAWTSPIPSSNPRPQPQARRRWPSAIWAHLGPSLQPTRRPPTDITPTLTPLPTTRPPGGSLPVQPPEGPPLCSGLQSIARAPSPTLQNSLASSQFGLMPQPQAWSPCSWGFHWPRHSWLTSPDSLLHW